MIGRLRLASGLILTLFVLGHFINHALGIVSIKAMNDALGYTIQPWRDPFGEFLLVSALLVHVALACWALYQRRSLGMSLADKAQIASGFLIPILLGSHVLATRGLHEAFGVVEGYQFTLFGMWVTTSFYGILNLFALPVVWFHACLGWHHWLRLKRWYPPLRAWAFAFAIALPTLALAGYISASYRVVRLARNERWVENLFQKTQSQIPDFVAFIGLGETIIWFSVPLIVAAIFAARWLRSYIGNRKSAEQIRYRSFGSGTEKLIPMQPAINLLDQFRLAQVHHPSVCGGRGRCSTCRVRVDQGLENLPPPGPGEVKVLQRIKAPADVRLACQTKPVLPVSVTALLRPDSGPEEAYNTRQPHSGEEQEIAILFADIRDFTKLSEARLPYDTAFMLNRYFAAMGKAIESEGGHLDKFIGDGVMALFGVDETLEKGCRKAIRAAAAMSIELQKLNEIMRTDIGQELRIGIGIHCGTAIVGNMGYNKAISLTAIGDVVNTASRLEALTKQFSAQLVVSEKTAKRAKVDLSSFTMNEAEIRGRVQPLPVRIIEDASAINRI